MAGPNAANAQEVAPVGPAARTEPPAREAAAPDGSVLRRVLAILSPAERRRIALLLPAVVGMALLETAGVASIVPFMGLLSDPEAIERNRMLAWAYRALGFTSSSAFFFLVGLLVLALVTVGNVVSALTTWALLRFSWSGSHTLSTRLLESYLARPYAYFLQHNSADLAKNILAEVQSVVTGILVQGVQLTARITVVIFVTGALLIIDPLMAVGVAVSFGGIYGGIYTLVRRRVARGGRERVASNQARFKVAAEALGGIKELKLYGLETLVLEQYSVPSRRFSTLQANNIVLAQLPRFALETIAFGGVLLMVLYLLRQGRALNDVLPVLGVYAFAAYRLLPGLQVVFAGLTTIRFNLGALDVLHRDLHREAPPPPPPPSADVHFRQSVEVADVRFGYESADRAALDGVTLSVSAGEWVALIGPTGSGKSTLVDILLGLLEPASGALRVDGVALSGGRLAAWQRLLAYVPQQIFLVDDTIALNICFGIPAHAIDPERLRWAAKIAQIHDFIESELPSGYDTVVGERGVRLSGGQRQRIGIARALYRRPKLLVLDEATSALDNATEAAFFDAMHAELSDTAVVSIAHRLSTTRSFDRLYVLERGAVVDVGSYAELSARSPHFRTEAQQSERPGAMNVDGPAVARVTP